MGKYLTGFIEGIPIYSDDPPFLSLGTLMDLGWRYWLIIALVSFGQIAFYWFIS